MNAADEVRFDVKGGVARITIDRPERRNALNARTSELLVDFLGRAEQDDDVTVIVLTGAGDRAFCAGADLKELDETASRGRQIHTPMTGPIRNIFEVVLETYKPVIARLNGPAVAGGCELALACDIRVAAEHAHLAMPEAKRGMGANFATVMLPRMLPSAIAYETLYTGESLAASEAYRWGLYNRVVPAHDLDEVTDALAAAIAANAPLTLRRVKEMAVKSAGHPIASALRLNVGPNPYLSADREEGVRAYLEKRAPVWQGR
ncbi:MAG: enoyl-CoA hydratase [Pseudonocardia sp. SCN 72-86]|nr:MAG: enoyl-CoA hydratase [Pseudonocardia sp. SCN 72-86]